MKNRYVVFTSLVGLLGGCAGALDEEPAEITDEMVEQEAARLAAASNGQFELGGAFAYADVPDGDDKTAVINGFPTTGPDGANFVQQLVSITDNTISTLDWRVANWAFYSPARLYHRSGDIDTSTTQEHLAYTADSSDGDSGSAVFYYTDNATTYNGQAHYILGVHSGGLDGNGFNTGPTVHSSATGSAESCHRTSAAAPAPARAGRTARTACPGARWAPRRGRRARAG
jgi:hypothetical protein